MQIKPADSERRVIWTGRQIRCETQEPVELRAAGVSAGAALTGTDPKAASQA